VEGSSTKQHPEFFRVSETGDHVISLLARHVLPKTNGVRELPIDFTGKLLESAINLYDRETSRRERWKWIVPIISTVLGGILAGVFAVWVSSLKDTPKAHQEKQKTEQSSPQTNDKSN
jgi:hypothetical protein